ncbi:hypothetical protein [Nocardioides sp.]|uniref:hypothetical protein n=1 Tax=Nocardioides sp. TaxID=35761 RepID=UPI00260D9E64|nr:hypothetical protein [Nocardioides sp.]MDI6912377.1 hypothetical protein [Nocardioides sp.]
MTDPRVYTVVVGLASQDDCAVLLSLASVLHRRRIPVRQVELTPPAYGRRVFTATFTATDRQAATLEASLRNLIEVDDVVLVEAAEVHRSNHHPESRGADARTQHPSRGRRPADAPPG